ncbi:MAG: anthranilate phosphoribosyltransferase [Deltaproteobacteria bacterium CG_4_10_14_3_um_filter_60_8]|nr:MAG: anthranilate phosphoribosyltransferase [Desulfobacterales bacterium CG2_30_60_27]PIY20700.1 MAG: anthranilate phosphoribosyltransferase [Deltaproteobacteria bacterium CG_4_10_14_3_um_filter_60_8]
MIREAIAKVVQGEDLSEAQMVGAMQEIMGGEATAAQIGALITALRMKGETIEEITGAARVMRDKATRVEAVVGNEVLVDTCGTGGDASGTFNVSTTAAFAVAGAGVKVAKHGNRSITSHCGSADVLEALGVDLTLSAEQIGRCIREIGIGFMFAPALHGAMKHAIGPRREIGIRTIFNLLGPLTNPAGANVQVMGVFAPSLIVPLATVLGRLGVRRALVVCGAGNLDEITVTGETRVADYADGLVRTYEIRPEDFGMHRATLADIKGGQTAQEAAAQLRAILGNAAGPCLDMVLMNAGAALMAAGKTTDLRAGVELARQTVASGAALAKLDNLVAFGKAR